MVQGGKEYEYDRWSQYKAFYNTPDADREYVLYWEKMVKEIKVLMVQWSASPSLKLCSVKKKLD